MSSGKFCCKSWRKLLVPGSCPTSLLEVNCCFFSTAKNTCASILAAPAHSPASSSAPAHPAAGFVLSVLQQTPHLQLFMGLGIFLSFLYGVDAMQRGKERMKTWQKWFLLPDRNHPAREPKSNIFPSLSSARELAEF